MGPKRPLLTPFEQRVSPGQATPSLESRRCGSKAMGHFLKYARSAYGQGMRLGGWLHQAGFRRCAATTRRDEPEQS